MMLVVRKVLMLLWWMLSLRVSREFVTVSMSLVARKAQLRR